MSSETQKHVPKRIRIHDNRCPSTARRKSMDFRVNFSVFLQDLRNDFDIGHNESFVLTLPNREFITSNNYGDLQNGTILLLFKNKTQATEEVTSEQINIQPHYDTLLKSGVHEYYASEGKDPLPYTFAELVDNSLSATAKNEGVRSIQIRVLKDDTIGKPALIVLDNGCGMTSNQLKNWATFRNSKFNRDQSGSTSGQDSYVRPDDVPRSLNSDISYFGIGGKQAVFYFGEQVRMITKSVNSDHVNELILSKEDFKRKQEQQEDVYKTAITKRMLAQPPGNIEHDERFLHDLIAEEAEKTSFTAVVITKLHEHIIEKLHKDFDNWTTDIAHVYHYYIHGFNGNDGKPADPSEPVGKVDIEIIQQLKASKSKCLRRINLRDVDTDMQTLYIRAAVDQFEFKACVGEGVVEGLLRYHPFLYHEETYPHPPTAGDQEEATDDMREARGNRPIFECYWNGRLIPYTTISEFPWCAQSNKNEKVPQECYGRFSGILFANDRFEVTTNKLTFTDLSSKLNHKDAIFTCKNAQAKRDIKKGFTVWLENCHKAYDKEIKFVNFLEVIQRDDLTPKGSWSAFAAIEWDGKKYKKGKQVKSVRTVPVHHGTVIRFLLTGEQRGDVFAAGGLVELTLEPRARYNQTKTLPISKIDHTATEESIRVNIKQEELTLPSKLKLTWRASPLLTQNDVLEAGRNIGPVQVEILNQKEESMGSMTLRSQRRVNAFSVRLKLVHHDPTGDQELYSCDATFSAKWGFWFNKMDKLRRIGKYSLTFNSMLEDSTEFGGRALPSAELAFVVKAGCAKMFEVSRPITSVTVGQLFDIKLQFKDHYSNLTSPPAVEPILNASGLTLTTESKELSDTMLTLKVIAVGTGVKEYDLCVTVPDLKNPSQTVKFSLLPGAPHFLSVIPSSDPLEVENGTQVTFSFEVLDIGSNVTVRKGMIVETKILKLPPMKTDCSRTGAGQLTTQPIKSKPTTNAGYVEFHIPDSNIPKVMRRLCVLPSTRVSRIEIFREGDENLVLRDKVRILRPPGESLKRLRYKLFDEADREIPPSPRIAQLIKVTWTANLNPEELVEGKLPAIQVPTQVQEEKLCRVDHYDCSVSFTIIARPDEPRKLRVTLPQKSVRLGQTLQGKIILDLRDKYDNATLTLTPTCVGLFGVEAEGLDKSALTWNWEQSSCSLSVTGLRFLTESLGPKEISFTYKDFVARVSIQVTPGVPAILKLVTQPEQPLQIINDHGIPTPFIIQVCDQSGNACAQENVAVKLRSLSPALKFKATSQPVDAEGRVSFTVNSVTAPRGSYTLEFSASFNSSFIRGPSFNLIVILDSNKPASLMVEFDRSASFHAGERFPVFSLKVLSEEGGPIPKGSIQLGDVSMWIWSGGPVNTTPPDTAITMKCVHYSNDCFHFRDKEIPEQSGRHTIQFSMQNERAKLVCEQISIDVLPNEPFKLGCSSQVTTPVVSMTKRTLVENLILKIMDRYENPTGQDLTGTVTVKIIGRGADNYENIPELDGNTSTFTLSKGSVCFPRLAIQQHSRGDNAAEYTLVFKPEVSNVSLEEFQLRFHFYDDDEHHRKMADLSKKRDELTAWIKDVESMFTGHQQLKDVYMESCRTTLCKEAMFRSEMTSKKLPTILSVSRVVTLLEEKKAEAERLLSMRRRTCSIPNRFIGEQNVLGTVGHLACVEDDDAARVISWHVSGDMDCVITMTTAAGKTIYDKTQGMQQVMSLDSVFVPSGNRPLPHIRNDSPLFAARGNPVHARELLVYQKDWRSCDLTFRNILGGTILMDDMDSALHYRREVVQRKLPCPTILTRTGDRVSGRGKFGGRQNRVPTGNFPVFAAPLPKDYKDLMEVIELLNHYQKALETKEEAHTRLTTHTEEMNSPEMARKREELEEKKKLLVELTRQLASHRKQPAKRSSVAVGEPSGVSGKRARKI